LELSFMLDVAASMVECAKKRTESRGAHQRSDFPKRDDQNFLAHSMVLRKPDGTAQVQYSPVTITRWPPGERVYGQPAEKAAKG
jgi:fumarate reductase flavoprotein subunit